MRPDWSSRARRRGTTPARLYRLNRWPPTQSRCWRSHSYSAQFHARRDASAQASNNSAWASVGFIRILCAITRPRLALAGLKPHAGENGLIGDEEQKVFPPVVESCRARGVDVSDPIPGDTVFRRAAEGEFDAVIACYHDQGLIPIKLMAFGRAVEGRRRRGHPPDRRQPQGAARLPRLRHLRGGRQCCSAPR